MLDGSQISPEITGIDLDVLGGETGKGIKSYSSSLGFKSESQFVNFISEKAVCDVGAGYGGFAIECFLRGIPVKVTSVNPRIENSQFKMDQSNYFKWLRKFHSNEDIQRAIEYFKTNAFPQLAHELIFPDNSYDVVLDIDAITLYAIENDIPGRIGRSLYKKSIEQMVRILKPGGHLLIGDPLKANLPEKFNWPEQVFKELGLQYSKIYEPRKHIFDRKRQALGYDITK